MSIQRRNIDTLNDALTELDDVLKDQPMEMAEILTDLLGRNAAKSVIGRSQEVIQWLADRLNELADGAEVLDVLSALTEVVLDLFRFFKEALTIENSEIPGLNELARLFPSGGDVDQIEKALEWLPDPTVLQLLQQHVSALVDAPDGGLYQITQYLESNQET